MKKKREKLYNFSLRKTIIIFKNNIIKYQKDIEMILSGVITFLFVVYFSFI